jgi:aryl-alcohol dehydrogenase-like predicted oxidoreductase
VDVGLQYLLSQPVSAVVVDCASQAELELHAAAATSFRQLTSAELARFDSRHQPGGRA